MQWSGHHRLSYELQHQERGADMPLLGVRIRPVTIYAQISSACYWHSVHANMHAHTLRSTYITLKIMSPIFQGLPDVIQKTTCWTAKWTERGQWIPLSHLPVICCANLYKILKLSESYSHPLGRREFREMIPCKTFCKCTIIAGLRKTSIWHLFPTSPLLSPSQPSKLLPTSPLWTKLFTFQVTSSLLIQQEVVGCLLFKVL